MYIYFDQPTTKNKVFRGKTICLSRRQFDGCIYCISMMMPPSECFRRGAGDVFVAVSATTGRRTATMSNGFDYHETDRSTDNGLIAACSLIPTLLGEA